MTLRTQIIEMAVLLIIPPVFAIGYGILWLTGDWQPCRTEGFGHWRGGGPEADRAQRGVR